MKNREVYQNTTKRFLFCCILMLLIFLVIPRNVFATEQRVIRVGYDSNSNFIKENDGHYYGYGVEYLEKIAEYTGWKYEYIKDDSWHESLSKLRKGSIDLICTAHYTEQRAAEFVYSEFPIGYETSIMYAKPDSSISYQDYEALQNSRVGLLGESYSASEFEKYAEEMQINYEGVYFERENDMKKALANGQIDIMVVGSRYATPEMKLVDISGIDAFYCITQPENYALVEEIDAILQEIMFDEPAFEGNLRAKYFGHESVSSSPLYTKEELAYIENLGTIKVKLFQDQHPSCYVENGETKGIWADVIRLLAKESGIDIVLEGGDLEDYSEEALEQYMNEGYLLLRTQNALEYMSSMDDMNGIVSNAITKVSIAYVRRQAAFMEDNYVSHVIAITKDLAYLEPMLLEENPEFEVKYFEDAKACFEALINKQAGMVIQNSHRASFLMQKPEYADKLAVVPGIDHGNNVCLMAPSEQEMLINILNKAIHHITNEEISEIVKRELLMSPYPLETEDFVYQNWRWLIIVAGLFLLAVIGYAVFTNKLANARIQKKEFELLQKKVQRDDVTGLYNRAYFYKIMQERIQETKEEMCIVSMDISNFKVVNELHGMNVGDRLLKEVGTQIKKLGENHNMISARFMSDHFYMGIAKSEFDKIDFPRIFKTFLEGIDIRVVYGVYQVVDENISVNIMCDRAREAVRDKNYRYIEYIHFYNDSERRQALMEKKIEDEMEQALEECQFYVVIQPKYDAKKNQIVGGEALVRWQHPKKGSISPGAFIPVFEKNGFIIQLDYFIWAETCRLQAQMKQKGITTVPISINVSRIHFYSSELRNKLRELIQEYGLEPSDIELEITESVCGEKSGNIIDIIKELQADGFQIAMDDFGSGYSSLNMLKEMPVDIIKMDMAFLGGEEKKSRVILKALIEMAQIMELKVVVEGVELLSQVEFLSQFENCYMQGYYYSRPVTSDVFETMLK